MAMAAARAYRLVCMCIKLFIGDVGIGVAALMSVCLHRQYGGRDAFAGGAASWPIIGVYGAMLSAGIMWHMYGMS